MWRSCLRPNPELVAARDGRRSPRQSFSTFWLTAPAPLPSKQYWADNQAHKKGRSARLRGRALSRNNLLSSQVGPMGAPETGNLNTSRDLVVVEAEIDRLIESALANQAYLSRIAAPADVPFAAVAEPAAHEPAALDAAPDPQKQEAAAPAAKHTAPGRPATGLVLGAILVAVAGLAYFAYQPRSVPPTPPQEIRAVNVPAQAAGGPITHLPASEPPAAAAAPATTQAAAAPSPRPQAKRSAASAVVPVAAPEPSAPAAGTPGRSAVTHTRPASAAVPAEVKAAPAVVQSSPAREATQGPVCTQEMAALGFCVASGTAEAR